jgi:Arc/MetJ-type ribon-helix-helix transcriptional regulator
LHTIQEIKMKQKISITIDEQHIKLIENILQDSRFRNRSHIIEHSLRQFLDKTDLEEEN